MVTIKQGHNKNQITVLREKKTIYETNKLSVYYIYRLQLHNQTSDKIKP